MAIPLPKWLDRDYEIPEQKTRAQTRFLLRLAALYASEGGSMSDLARILGYKNPHQLSSVLYVSGKVPPELAIALERAIGRKVIARSQLRPDIFATD